MSEKYTCVECPATTTMPYRTGIPAGWRRLEVSITVFGNTYRREGLACPKCLKTWEQRGRLSDRQPAERETGEA